MKGSDLPDEWAKMEEFREKIDTIEAWLKWNSRPYQCCDVHEPIMFFTPWARGYGICGDCS